MQRNRMTLRRSIWNCIADSLSGPSETFSIAFVIAFALGLMTSSACNSPQGDTETENTPPAAEGTGASVDTGPPAEVRTLFRESLEYRNAHEALANNAGSLAADVERTERMLREVEAIRRVPLVEDPRADGVSLMSDLAQFADGLGVEGVSFEAFTVPAPEPAPERVRTAEEFSYTAEQTAGIHDVTARIPNGLLNGPVLFNALDEFDRLFVSTSAVFESDGAVILTGQVAFFRSLAPVTFVLPEVDVESLIGEATAGAILSENTQQIIADVQSNFERAFSVRERIEEALAHEALIEINVARFEFYSAWVDRFNGTRSWSALLRGVDE